MEKEAAHTDFDSEEKEVEEMEKAEIAAGLTKQHDAILKGVQEHLVKVSQEELIEKEKEQECMNADEMEVAAENDSLVVISAGDHKHSVKGVHDGEDLKSMGRMLTINSQEVVSSAFWKTKHKRWRIGVRRWKKPEKNTVPAGFPVAQTSVDGRRGEDSPTQGRMWWWRKLCNHGKKKRAVEFRATVRRGFAKGATAVGNDVGIDGVGNGGDGDAADGGERSKIYSGMGVVVAPRANEKGMFLRVVEGGSFTFASSLTVVSIRARGTEVKSPNHDKTADVIYSHFSPIPIFGPIFSYRPLRIWLAHTSTISLGLQIFFEVLARNTFYPP